MNESPASAGRPLSLRDERADALDHGLALIRRAWTSFDVARPHQPPVSHETLGLLESALPEAGIGVRAALDAADHVLDESLAQTRPRFFGYVGSSGLESAVLADALAMSHDVNLAAESAAAYLVEQQTLGWVARLVGYPAAGGTVTSGGMISNLTALMAARTRALPESRLAGVAGVRAAVYASAEAHSSVERAVEVLGLGRDALRSVPTDRRRRMDPAALAAALAADLAAGVTPIAVVATAGTTLTGAVDPVGEIADVVDGTGAWLHVDGAYGLPAACTEVAGHLFTGLDRADSVSVDAHKWLFVSKACGILLVRDPGTLRAAFRHDASYMLEEDGYAHPVDGTMEYSRPFRALKLWTALRAHGAEAFRAAVTTTIEMARELAQVVRERPGLELLVDEPELSTVPFPPRPDARRRRRAQPPPGAGDAGGRAGVRHQRRRRRALLPAPLHRQLPHHPGRRAGARRHRGGARQAAGVVTCSSADPPGDPRRDHPEEDTVRRGGVGARDVKARGGGARGAGGLGARGVGARAVGIRGPGATGEVVLATVVTLVVVVGGAFVWWLRPSHGVPPERAETLRWSGRFGPAMPGHWAKLVFEGYTDAGNPQILTREAVQVRVSVTAPDPVEVAVLSAGYPVRPHTARVGTAAPGEYVITPAADACLVPILVYVRGVTPTSAITAARAVVTYHPLRQGRACPATDEPTG